MTDYLEIRAPLEYEGYNYTARELTADLRDFFKEQVNPNYQAGDNWEYGYFYCRMPKELALVFLLKHPNYRGSFESYGQTQC